MIGGKELGSEGEKEFQTGVGTVIMKKIAKVQNRQKPGSVTKVREV